MSGRSERNFFGPVSGANIAIAGQGYMTGGMLPVCSVITGSGGSHTANQVAALMFVLPFSITIRKVAARISTAFGAGVVFNLGIYSADRNTKLVEASFDANITTRQTVTLATPVTLPPGVYWFAWAPGTGAAGTGQYAAISPGAMGFAETYNAIPILGIAGNPMAGGLLPATLGTITPSGAGINNTALGIFWP